MAQCSLFTDGNLSVIRGNTIKNDEQQPYSKIPSFHTLLIALFSPIQSAGIRLGSHQL